jgi:hypothetical protein
MKTHSRLIFSLMTSVISIVLIGIGIFKLVDTIIELVLFLNLPDVAELIMKLHVPDAAHKYIAFAGVGLLGVGVWYFYPQDLASYDQRK